MGLLLNAIVFSAGAGTGLGFLGAWWWRLDLLAHFRLQYAAMLAVAVLGYAAIRWWKAAAASGVALLTNAVLLAPLWFTPPQPAGAGPTLRVLAFNVLTSNTRYDEVIDWVELQGADVVVLQELNRAWWKAVEAGLDGYVGVETDAIREDNFGLAVYVREGLTVRDFEYVEDAAGVPRIEVVVEVGDPLGDVSVRLIAVHTVPPVHAANFEARGAQLAEAGQRANQSAEPVVLLGDLNATRWSAPLRRLLRTIELRDSAEGFGGVGTWPSGLWWSGMIPIDHVLVGPEFRVEDRWVGPALGSDHRAVVVDMTVTRKKIGR